MPAADRNGQAIHVLQVIGSQVGGIRKHVHSILKRLPSERLIFSYAYSTVTFDRTFQDELSDISRLIGGRLLPLAIRRSPDISDMINLFHLARFAAKERVDLVHGHGAKGGLYARLLAMLLGIKAIYTPHGGVAHRMFSPMSDRLYTAVEKLLAPWTELYLFESSYSATAFEARLGRKPERQRINYNGISEWPSLPMPPCRRPDGQLHLGVFGMLRAEKGQQYAIQALQILRSEGINAQLHLFGDGPNKSRLQCLAARLQVAEHTRFWGDVIQAERYMQSMDMVLIPSLFESFGYAAVEALALKRPVIASDVGGLKEVIIHGVTGIAAEAGNPRQIADGVKQCIACPELVRELIDNGYRRYRQLFTEDQMCSCVKKVYLDVIAHTPL